MKPGTCIAAVLLLAATPAAGQSLDEILAKIVSDSICISSYKASVQGSDHKRVPKDIDVNPVIIGHEFCARLVHVGRDVRGFCVGERVTLATTLASGIPAVPSLQMARGVLDNRLLEEKLAISAQRYPVGLARGSNRKYTELGREENR